MPVMLRGQDGYYCATREIDGTTFYIADLGEHYDEFVDRLVRLQREVGIDEELTRNFDAEELLRRELELSTDPEQLKLLRRATEELVDWVLGVGLVRWSIPNAPCDAEHKRLLPNRVKAELYRAILSESTLTIGEASFPGRDGDAVGGGG